MGEEWEEEIKADRVGRCAGGRRRRVGIGRWWRGDGESQTGGGGGGQADLINEEMSDEQRQRGEASTSMRSTNNTDIQNIKKKTKNISGTVKQTHQLSHTHTNTHINTHTHTDMVETTHSSQPHLLVSLHQKAPFPSFFPLHYRHVNGVLFLHLAPGWPPVPRKNKLIPA